MNYWLMKSEADVYSIDDLARDKTTWWEGVRNYQARNFMIHDMKVGDRVLFYHSNSEPTGVMGLAEVSKPAAADATALDKKSPYFDPKATKEKPIWECVQVRHVKTFAQPVTLHEIKATSELKDMLLVQRGMRLSVQPVKKAHFEKILKLAGEKNG